MREAFTTAISMLRHLESLELTNCHDMTDGGVQSLSVLTGTAKHVWIGHKQKALRLALSYFPYIAKGTLLSRPEHHQGFAS